MNTEQAAWRARVERDLKGADFDERLVHHTDDGLPVQPLYTQATPGPRPLRRAPGFRALVVHGDSDLSALNAALKADLAGGADGAVLDLARLRLRDAPALEIALEGVSAPIALVGGGPVPALALLARGGGDLGLDPLGALAQRGAIAASAVDTCARLAAWTDAPRIFEVDARVYHRAGAGEAQALGLALATGVSYLRALDAVGLGAATGRVGFTLAVGSRFFESIATLRAFRRCWSRVAAAVGAEPAIRLRAWPAERGWTRRDPWVNMLRNTAAVFAGVVGGADEVVSLPFDAALGEPDALGRRVARNTPTILGAESHLGELIDPAGGSWFLESLTNAIAEKAWSDFQGWERAGGIQAALEAGSVQRAIAETVQARGERPIVGVTVHAARDEARLERPVRVAKPGPAGPALPPAPGDLDAAARALAEGATFDAVAVALDPPTALSRAEALPFRRDAAAHEATS